MTILSIADLLRHIPLFSDLSGEHLERLSLSTFKQRFRKGETIVQQGELSEALYMFLSGRAHVLRKNVRGAEVIISILQMGDHVGEMSLIDHEPHSASVRADADTDVLILDRDEFAQLMPKPSTVAAGVLLSLVKRLRYANEQIESLALMDVNGRVARMLLELAEVDVDGDLLIRTKPTIQDLAKMVGSSREMVSRVVKVLTDRGFIQADARNQWRVRTDIRSLTL